MTPIPQQTAIRWIKTMFEIHAVLERVRLGQPVSWGDALHAQVSAIAMCNDLLGYAMTDVAVETTEGE